MRLVLALLCLPGMVEAACRQALAFGLDVSGSVDAAEYRMQLDGLAVALNSDAVQDVLFIQPDAPIEILVYEWSGPDDQTIVVPWTPIVTGDDLADITMSLRNHPRTPASTTTALGAAMLAGFGYLDERTACWKRTLDISGDGQTNTGPSPQDIDNGQSPTGVIVNALVIGSGNLRGDDERFADIKELSSYFTTQVIRGPGSFVEVALGFENYESAMQRKLLRELSSLVVGHAIAN